MPTSSSSGIYSLDPCYLHMTAIWVVACFKNTGCIFVSALLSASLELFSLT